MTRKTHLLDTSTRVNAGPVCQKGRFGGELRGEHISTNFAGYVAAPEALRCERCAKSKLFAFLAKKAA